MSEMSAITEETLTRQVRHLMFWNQVWIALLCLAVTFGVVSIMFRNILERHARVHFSRHEGGIYIRSNQGLVLITHLKGISNGKHAAARLPTPLLLLDSAGAIIGKPEYKALKWRNESGEEEEAPPDGSGITALYVRLQTTD